VQRLTYAFRFITACFSLAIKHPRLRKPWLYFWMGGIALLFLWLILFSLVIAVAGIKPLGMVLIGLLIILLLFCLLAWGEITALETCWIFGDLIREDLVVSDSAQGKQEFAHWRDAFLWVLTLPGLELIRFFTVIFRPSRAAELNWLDASYLMLPVISLEDFSLGEGVERIKQLVAGRLLRFHPHLVGVRPVAGVLQWALILGGGLLGTRVGLVTADPATAGLLSRLFAVALGMMLAGILALLGIFISSFSRACYYTTLYQWALNVESARMTGVASRSVPPVILSQVMRLKNLSKKE